MGVRKKPAALPTSRSGLCPQDEDASQVSPTRSTRPGSEQVLSERCRKRTLARFRLESDSSNRRLLARDSLPALPTQSIWGCPSELTAPPHTHTGCPGRGSTARPCRPPAFILEEAAKEVARRVAPRRSAPPLPASPPPDSRLCLPCPHRLCTWEFAC